MFGDDLKMELLSPDDQRAVWRGQLYELELRSELFGMTESIRDRICDLRWRLHLVPLDLSLTHKHDWTGAPV